MHQIKKRRREISSPFFYEKTSFYLKKVMLRNEVDLPHKNGWCFIEYIILLSFHPYGIKFHSSSDRSDIIIEITEIKKQKSSEGAA